MKILDQFGGSIDMAVDSSPIVLPVKPCMIGGIQGIWIVRSWWGTVGDATTDMTMGWRFGMTNPLDASIAYAPQLIGSHQSSKQNQPYALITNGAVDNSFRQIKAAPASSEFAEVIAAAFAEWTFTWGTGTPVGTVFYDLVLLEANF